SAETQLRFTRLVAPFPGVVVKRYRNLGDFASPGVAVLSMYNPDLLYVTANLEETRLRGVAPGNAVELRIDAFSEPFRGRVVWINKSTGAQFALMPRNVVAGEFTKVVQRVPVRIWIEKDKRWPLLRAGLSVSVAIAHGDGDAQWAEQAARELEELETRYNRPPQPTGGGHAAHTRRPHRRGGGNGPRRPRPPTSSRPRRPGSSAGTGWRPWRCSLSSSRPTRRWCRPPSPTTPSARGSRSMTTT